VYAFMCRKEFNAKMEKNEEAKELYNLVQRHRGTELEQVLKEKYIAKVAEMDVKSKFI
jgi:hypothetical protein